MSDKAHGPKPEIVIIRRKAPDEIAAHKGGAWKIAYADFVTAMMAFFLVMWLINAANEATRAQVASYFNPIKLTDSATGGRGLNDPKDAKVKDKQKGNGAEKATDGEKAQEQQALADPVKTLEKVAGKSPASAIIFEQVKTVVGPSNAPSDPFDPLAWQPAGNATEAPPSPDVPRLGTAQEPPPPAGQSAAKSQQLVAPHITVTAAKADSPDIPAPEAALPKLASETNSAGERKAATKPIARSAKTASREKPIAGRTPDNPGESPNNTESLAAPANAQPAAGAAAVPPGAADQAAAAIKAEIFKRLAIDPGDLPANIEVKATPEGQLISLTDRTAFGMFQVGSSVPDPKLLALVATIAAVIKDRAGFIVVRGHTDSRPYRNRHYDNWQLSAARAQMAYYMLVRGGLDDRRVRRIEGYADRAPAIPDHPDAPENRRIEILLGQDP